MATISIDVLNPKALNLLEDLAQLRLISIRKEMSNSNEFMDWVEQIRSKSVNPPSLKEITAEVEQTRAEM
jgi:transcriptional regulator NrdR family protein